MSREREGNDTQERATVGGEPRSSAARIAASVHGVPALATELN